MRLVVFPCRRFLTTQKCNLLLRFTQIELAKTILKQNTCNVNLAYLYTAQVFSGLWVNFLRCQQAIFLEFFNHFLCSNYTTLQFQFRANSNTFPIKKAQQAIAKIQRYNLLTLVLLHYIDLFSKICNH